MPVRITKNGGRAVGDTVIFEACDCPEGAIITWMVEYGAAAITLNSTSGPIITGTITDNCGWLVSAECCVLYAGGAGP